VLVENNILYVFFSRVGNSPERIVYTAVDLNPDDWKEWKSGPVYELLSPEMKWEGSKLPITPSLKGEIAYPVNQLRDPYIYKTIICYIALQVKIR
jgi:hypothetical protein|tara:strand:+ start:2501 stop:2785 length:285 start_codon:yes stop_codon:yes gene_type:complete